MMPRIATLFTAASMILAGHGYAQAQRTGDDQARATLLRVVDFYRSQVGYQGAYLWRYSSDLQHQEGETEAKRTSGWIQPPGTPSVGEAYLAAWQRCGQPECLAAAVEAAHALVHTQLESGGWSSHIEMGPQDRQRFAYRVDGPDAGKNNLSTFDDDKSQSAMMLLMHVDEELEFADPRIHAAVDYGLSHMLASQYSNGAWPQQFAGPTEPTAEPERRSSYPAEWSRTYPAKRYSEYYTLNDGNMSHIVDMLFEAHRIYDRDDCFAAAKRTGDFLLLAQLPPPQPGWAQQYNQQMHPAWARKFEPPAITGGESQGVLRTLMVIYQFTGDRRYLAPIPKALAYYRSSLLPDGKLARFYELQTNRPLYFTKDYQLTYSDADMPTHYAFKVGSKLDSIQKSYDRLLKTPTERLKPQRSKLQPVERTPRVVEQGERAIAAVDDRGAWVESGKMLHTDQDLDVIDMRTFIRQLDALATLVGSTPAPEAGRK